MSLLFFTIAFPGNRGLAVSLADPERHPAHERLAGLQRVVNDWRGRHPKVPVTKDTVGSAPPHFRTVELAEYLYGDGAFNPGRLARHLDQMAIHGAIHRYGVRPGTPVEGLDLFAREQPVNTLREALCAGRSAHLRAPRRYGKTSVLHRVEQTCLERGRPSLLLDVCPGETAAWLLVALAGAAMDRPACRAGASSLPELAGWPPADGAPLARSDARKRLATTVGVNWKAFGQRLFTALAGVGAVLILDEFSIFLRAAMNANKTEARAVADLLRSARCGNPPVAQILAGSAGLGSYIRFLDMQNEFEDLVAVDLPPLDADEGRDLAEELLYGLGARPMPDAAAAMLNEIGAPVPYFLHVLADAVSGETGGGRVVSAETARNAYRTRVLGPWANIAFRPYRLAAQPYPDELRKRAGQVLRVLARSATPVPRDALRNAFGPDARFDSVLACLQEDYDLVEAAGGDWSIRSKVLRDRWALAEAWLTEEGAG